MVTSFQSTTKTKKVSLIRASSWSFLFFSLPFFCSLATSCLVIVSGDEMAKQGIQISWPHINHFVLEKTEQVLTLIHSKDTTHYKI